MNKIDLSKVKISTKRLRLFPISSKYKKDIFKEFTSRITTYMYPKAYETIKDTEEFINKSIKDIKTGSDLQLVILDKDSREFIGCLGLHNLNKNTSEIGIWLKLSSHGNRYGKEAVKSLYDWSLKNYNFSYVLYPVADKNIASRKIAELLGGIIKKEYDEVGLSGNRYHCLEYRIYPEN